MSRKALISVIALLIISLSLYHSCSFENERIFSDDEMSINLRWIPGLEVTTKNHAETGFLWGMAQLGAFLPEGCTETAMSWQDRVLNVDFKGLGFDEKIYETLVTILNKLKQSEEYQRTNAVDMGRFLMLTIGTVDHYYQIVDMPATLIEFRAKYNFGRKVLKLSKSAVAHADRLIYIANANTYSEIAYIGSESEGSFDKSSFEPDEFETIDIMPNGQPRFGIYDENGLRKNWAKAERTLAGKPGKCMWCHESKVNGLVIENSVFPDSETVSEEYFQDLVSLQMEWLKSHRNSIKTELNYRKWREHQKMERIYEHFMEPSISRIAIEWNLTESKVSKLLKEKGIKLHKSTDFGNVYHRDEIDGLSPYKVVRVPGSAREKTRYEPNFF